MLRIPRAQLACFLAAAAGLLGCSVDQSALVPPGDATVSALPDGGGDAGTDSSRDTGAPADSSRDTGTPADSGRDTGAPADSGRDTGVPADSATPDGGCTPSDSGVEVCNGVDDDCDGTVDEEVTTTYYRDDDGDGYGVDDSAVPGCVAPADFSTRGGDCDDDDDQRYPGRDELCTMSDTNCDGRIDEDCPCTSVIGGGRLYSFCRGAHTYDEARELCINREQDLAQIENAAENGFVVGEVYARDLGVAYVGLHDDGHEGDWRWANEEALSYDAWGSDEPNNSCGRRCDENCGVVGWSARRANRSWNDVDCGVGYAAVCESSAP